MNDWISIALAVGGTLVGSGMAFGVMRGSISNLAAKVDAVDAAIGAMFRKIDKLFEKLTTVEQEIARHDERIKNLKSDLHEVEQEVRGLRGGQRERSRDITHPIPIGEGG